MELNPKALWIIGTFGTLLSVLGSFLAMISATFDLLNGGGQVGDSQLGAFFISMSILLFGFMLLQLHAHLQLHQRIAEIEALKKGLEAKPHGFLFRHSWLASIFTRLTPLGVVGALLGIGLMAGLVLKDYEPLLNFDIGPTQMMAIFAGSALAIFGLGIMTLGNSVQSNSLRSLVIKLGASIEEGGEEVSPGSPIRIKSVVKSPMVEPGPTLAEPSKTVELIAQAQGTESMATEPGSYFETPPSYLETPPIESDVTPTTAEEPSHDDVNPEDGYKGGDKGVPLEIAQEGYGEAQTFGTEDSVDAGATSIQSEFGMENMEGQTGSSDIEAQDIPTHDEAADGLVEGDVVEHSPEVEDEGGTLPGIEVDVTSYQIEERSLETSEISGPPGPTELASVENTPSPEMVEAPKPEPLEEPTDLEEIQEVQPQTPEPVTEEDQNGSDMNSNVLQSIMSEISQLDSYADPEGEIAIDKEETAEIPSTCPNCGQNLKPHWKGCPFCGLEFR